MVMIDCTKWQGANKDPIVAYIRVDAIVGICAMPVDYAYQGSWIYLMGGSMIDVMESPAAILSMIRNKNM